MTERYWHVLKSPDTDTTAEPVKSVPVELLEIEITRDSKTPLYTARYRYPCGATYSVMARPEPDLAADVKAEFLAPQRFDHGGICPICQDGHPPGQAPLTDIVNALENTE